MERGQEDSRAGPAGAPSVCEVSLEEARGAGWGAAWAGTPGSSGCFPAARGDLSPRREHPLLQAQVPVLLLEGVAFLSSLSSWEFYPSGLDVAIQWSRQQALVVELQVGTLRACGPAVGLHGGYSTSAC